MGFNSAFKGLRSSTDLNLLSVSSAFEKMSLNEIQVSRGSEVVKFCISLISVSM